MDHNTTWVLVANCCEAKLYKISTFPKLEEFKELTHPESKLHVQDLASREQGRNFQSGGTTRHAYQPETDPKKHEIDLFAKSVADYLSSACQKNDFARLYIVAPPNFLGSLRSHLNGKITKTIVQEFGKDMLKHDKADVEKLISTKTY
jgi:protein required for attachment to host cells